jgi:hypothetical protein
MKRKLFLLSAMALVITGAMFWSCQKEEMMNTEDVMLKKGKVAATSANFTYAGTACLNQEHTFNLWIGDENGAPDITLQIKYGSEWTDLVKQASVSNSTNELKATLTQLGSFNLRVVFKGKDYATGAITVENCVGCDDILELVSISACGAETRNAEFKFVAGEDGAVKIQGGLTGGPHGATNVVSQVKVNGVPQGSLSLHSYPVYNWIGELTECDIVEIEISWNASTEEIIDDWTVERDGTEVGATNPVECKEE